MQGPLSGRRTNPQIAPVRTAPTGIESPRWASLQADACVPVQMCTTRQYTLVSLDVKLHGNTMGLIVVRIVPVAYARCTRLGSIGGSMASRRHGTYKVQRIKQPHLVLMHEIRQDQCYRPANACDTVHKHSCVQPCRLIDGVERSTEVGLQVGCRIINNRDIAVYKHILKVVWQLDCSVDDMSDLHVQQCVQVRGTFASTDENRAAGNDGWVLERA